MAPVDVAADPPPQPEMKNALVRHARIVSLAISPRIVAAVVFIFMPKSRTHKPPTPYCPAKEVLF